MSNIFKKFKDLFVIDPNDIEKEINEDEIPKKRDIFTNLREFLGLNEVPYYEFDEDTINEFSGDYNTQQQINKIEADVECLKHQLNVIENKIDVILAVIEQNRH